MTQEVQVRERPILFSGPMVRAILDGTKTQTRRVVKPQPNSGPDGAMVDLGGAWGLLDGDLSGEWRCPHGAPGDRLWVRETWSAQYEYPLAYRGNHVAWHHQTPPAWRLGSNAMRTYHRADRSMYDVCDYGEQGVDLVRHIGHGEAPKWASPIHMPRWASRLTLEVTSVRAERLQDISEEDAREEGVRALGGEFVGCYMAGGAMSGTDAVECFARLWDSLNAKRGHGWDANPWVWVVSFTRVQETPTTEAP